MVTYWQFIVGCLVVWVVSAAIGLLASLGTWLLRRFP